VKPETPEAESVRMGTGADGIDADAARPEVGGEVAHARFQRRLGDAHDVVVLDHALAADVAERDDRALAALHQRQSLRVISVSE
jgi:hypothetical protein